MTEHSIEELKRQYDAAKERARQAREASAVAETRWLDALFEATGFKGCVAECKTWKGATVRFLPNRVVRWTWGDDIQGQMLKKNGTPGDRIISMRVDKCVNLGPYTPPTTINEKGRGE